MNNDSAQVAVFIDYDNIEISVADTLGKDVQVEWDKVLETASRIGRTVLRRAYADWSEQRSVQRDLLGLGIELVHVSSKRGKNAADIRIVIDALDMLYNPNSQVTHVLLVSGDGDFTELVHRLREQGKVVIGIGISGTSAEYLVNACDEFIFYDKLIAPPSPAAKPKKLSPTEAPAPSFDIAEARLLLRRVLEGWESEWMPASELKKAMLRLNPSFHERNYGFSSFKEFLQAQQEMIHLRTSGDQLEAQLLPEAPPSPETILENYLQILAAQKIRMTPNEYRPAIIFKFHEFGKTGGLTLTQLKDRVHAHFEENAPHVTGQYITETAHQLFHTYCFTFEKEPNGFAAEIKLWDRRVSFVPEINRATELLDRCDRGILQKIGKALGSPDKIDREVAARLLYGSFRGERMLAHVNQLILALK
ncbi:MAG: NYN domain-containing protein [Anaerolineales bacterium]|nr:NYN domain-containing protein [Anaerolineales bacterium]